MNQVSLNNKTLIENFKKISHANSSTLKTFDTINSQLDENSDAIELIEFLSSCTLPNL